MYCDTRRASWHRYNEFAAGQSRLEQIRGVVAALSRTGPDDGV